VAPVWTLDSAANGDVDVIIQASICDTPGQCGSGHGDLELLIPYADWGSPTDYLVFYTEYDEAARPSGGFEEWSTRAGGAPAMPEPTAAILFGLGALVISRRRTRA
jgi:hypothetical protein